MSKDRKGFCKLHSDKRNASAIGIMTVQTLILMQLRKTNVFMLTVVKTKRK